MKTHDGEDNLRAIRLIKCRFKKAVDYQIYLLAYISLK